MVEQGQTSLITQSKVSMPVMNVRIVGVAVCDGFVGVFVRMGLTAVPWKVVQTLVMGQNLFSSGSKTQTIH